MRNIIFYSTAAALTPALLFMAGALTDIANNALKGTLTSPDGATFPRIIRNAAVAEHLFSDGIQLNDWGNFITTSTSPRLSKCIPLKLAVEYTGAAKWLADKQAHCLSQITGVQVPLDNVQFKIN